MSSGDESGARYVGVGMQLLLLLLIPPLFTGVAVAAASGPEYFAPGALVGVVIGVTAASLRREAHAMSSGE